MATISPMATVQRGAELADDVRVGAFAFIGPEVRIAAGCTIDAGATVMGRTEIGPDSHVCPMAVIGARPDGQNADGQCILGPENSIREHVTIYAGAAQPTRLGRENLIMVACRIGPGSQVGNSQIFANSTDIGSDVRIDDYVRTSGFTIIGDGAHVGAYTFVAGYAQVTGFVPPYAMVQGDPVRVRGVNTENLKRCGFPDADIRALKSAFRRIYNGAGEAADLQAVEELLARADVSEHVRCLAEAIRDGRGPRDG